ncbi:MAG TPA: hypothetical protein VLE70_06315 [Anaerolineae bacterium]|jgi:hypothetical protein|nr:hypothetical protein [Anaerolineae bacterium]
MFDMIMPVFDHEFTLTASQSAVAQSHCISSIETLTPFPILVQINAHQRLAEDSGSSFTLWFGLQPIQWKVGRSDVGQHGLWPGDNRPIAP